jgi:integrase
MAVISEGNLPLIMDLMAHAKADTTRIYIKLADKMRNTQLRKLDWNKFNE